MLPGSLFTVTVGVPPQIGGIGAAQVPGNDEHQQQERRNKRELDDALPTRLAAQGSGTVLCDGVANAPEEHAAGIPSCNDRNRPEPLSYQPTGTGR